MRHGFAGSPLSITVGIFLFRIREQVPIEVMKAAVQTTNSTSTLKISVVVPIFNEEAFIAQTLDGILAQDYPEHAFEVLVVDGESSDGTRDVVQQYADRYPHVYLLSNPKRWSSAARNVGIQAATGDVVIVVDGHCQFFDDQYLRNVETAFGDPAVDCLGRPQPLDVTDGSLIQSAIATARGSRLGHHPDSFIYSDQTQQVPAHSVAVAYRKSIFDEVGLFDEGFDACEDVELNHRVDKAGYTCMLVPTIRLRYYPRASLSSLFRQMARYGRGRVRLLRKHQDTFSIKSLLPAVFLAGLVVGAVASAAVPSLVTPYLGVVGLYLTILVFFSATLAFQAGNLNLAFLLPLVFMAIHFGAAYGSLKELLLGSSTTDAFDR